MGAIIGGSVAGVVVAIALLFGLWLRHHGKQLQESPGAIPLVDQPSNTGVTVEIGRVFRPSFKPPHILAPVSSQPHESGDEDDEHQEKQYSNDRTEYTELPPPAYDPSASGPQSTERQRAGSISPDTHNPFTSTLEFIGDAADTRMYNTDLSKFCAANRDIISPGLENKLRAAHWLPADDPSEIPAEYWRNTYGVEFFELKRVHEAYAR